MSASELREPLLLGFSAGQRRYGVFGTEFEAFETHVLGVTSDRLSESAGLEDASSMLAALEVAALEDLYLAHAASLGDEKAWRVLDRVLRGPLTTFARRRGASATEADEAAAEVMEMLAMGQESSPLASFAGRGSLFGWAAGILLRRLARLLGKKNSRGVGGDDVIDRADLTSLSPAEGAAVRELRTKILRRLEIAWEILTANERVALIAKYRDGEAQTAIANRLSVGEPRISRLLQAAIAKLAAAVDSLDPGTDLVPGSSAWTELSGAITDYLATRGSPASPTDGSLHP